MPTRVEDLEQRLLRSKAAINEIFHKTLECFLRWASWAYVAPIAPRLCSCGLWSLNSRSNKASRSLVHFRFRALPLRDGSAFTTSTASSPKLPDMSKAPAAWRRKTDAGDKASYEYRKQGRRRHSEANDEEDKRQLKLRHQVTRQTTTSGYEVDDDTGRRDKRRQHAASQTTNPGGETNDDTGRQGRK
jgi:hypothetical protein